MKRKKQQFNLNSFNDLDQLKGKFSAPDPDVNESEDIKTQKPISLTDEEFSREKGESLDRLRKRRKSGFRVRNTESGIAEIDIKSAFQSVEKALRELENEIRVYSAGSGKIIRLIHGYGSHGKGGKIAEAIPQILENLLNQGRVSFYIHGLDFNPSNPNACDFVGRHPELKNDPDYRFDNPGITLIEM